MLPLITLTGCGGEENDNMGNPQNGTNQAATQSTLIGTYNHLGSASQIAITFKKDGTCSLRDSSGYQSYTKEGTYEVNGNSVSVTMTTATYHAVMGLGKEEVWEINQQAQGTISSDYLELVLPYEGIPSYGGDVWNKKGS